MSFISEPSSLSRSSSQPLSLTNREHEELTRRLPWKSFASKAHSLLEEVFQSMATRGARRGEAKPVLHGRCGVLHVTCAVVVLSLISGLLVQHIITSASLRTGWTPDVS